MSTPLFQHTDRRTEERQRRRRHTIIHRPDSGMGLLSDMEDTDDIEGQETFDRISGILSSLIQEANEAVHGPEVERVLTSHSNKKKILTTSPITITTSESSKIPRPSNRKSRTPHHIRNVSTSSSSSSTTTCSNLFSPISASTSTTTSRSPSPIINKAFRQYTVLRPRSCPVVAVQRRSMTPMVKQHHQKRNNNSSKIDPITESFKRLDSSMALVDSLSRDLAVSTHNNSESNLTLLLLVPLLHIPHSLITMIFDFCTANPTSPNYKSFSMSSMFFWACVFAVTNLMVDQVAVLPKHYLTISSQKQSTRRMSLPGTYEKPLPPKRRQKQTWIPTTVQKSPFCLEKPCVQRRNSI
ncbi:hypothetical protein INT47_000546 [Mucor saturninus]|uniref:Uncharacterized protein n=1 Tax=Mucor saturninus TaxID=64648 RepID=A0A8H7V9V2_9FUNG|nr:hypothetical protein INT47_000546 [Mucor saturninus]